MKINFDAPIIDLAEKPMNDEKGDPVTLATVTVQALLATLRGDEAMAGTAKAECGHLGMRLFPGGEQDLKAEQVTMIKERIGRAFTPLIVARAWALLDPVEA